MHNSKKLAIAIALILTVSMTLSSLLAPVHAQSYTGHKKSYAYIGATPNPVAVGEQVLLHIGISEALQITEDKWKGLTVTITAPDGSNQDTRTLQH